MLVIHSLQHRTFPAGFRHGREQGGEVQEQVSAQSERDKGCMVKEGGAYAQDSHIGRRSKGKWRRRGGDRWWVACSVRAAYLKERKC